jgi:hypothetical protein
MRLRERPETGGAGQPLQQLLGQRLAGVPARELERKSLDCRRPSG